MKVEFHRHNLGQDETKAMTKAIQGLFLTSGPLTSEFEERFAQYLGCKRVVGVYSCTSALFLCLKALEIGPGDEVITTPLTFIASSNAIIEAGAYPVFVDVEPGTGNINPELLEAAITSRTKAVIVVHLYGLMCAMPKLIEIIKAHNLDLIEDAAHCIEGHREDIRPGQLSSAACFSFYATKNITSGEGGAIATNNDDFADQLMLMRTHGMNKEASMRYHQNYQHWDMVTMGYKVNMFDLQAALLLPQIAKLEDNLKKRDQIAAKYRQAFTKINGIDLPPIIPNTRHACHLFTIQVDALRRDRILQQLQAVGVGVAVNYRPVHLLSFYQQRFGFQTGDYPVAEKIGNRTISLPLYPSLSTTELDYVIEQVTHIISSSHQF